MIIIDSRIGSKHLLEPIKSRVHCPVTLATLEGGDVAFEGNGPNGLGYTIGIELKQLEDMLGSMRSGRLAGDQLHKMSADYDMCYLIVQGQYRPDERGNITVQRRRNGRTEWTVLDLAANHEKASVCFRYSELDKFIVSLEMKKNVVVVRSTTVMETVWQIINRYNWWQKAWEAHDSTDPIKTQAQMVFSKVSLLRDMASRLPGIGWTRSKEVEKTFRSIHHMVNAPVEMWLAVEGVGEKTAHNVWNELRKWQ